MIWRLADYPAVNLSKRFSKMLRWHLAKAKEWYSLAAAANAVNVP
jgi:hypothetical protein